MHTRTTIESDDLREVGIVWRNRGFETEVQCGYHGGADQCCRLVFFRPASGPEYEYPTWLCPDCRSFFRGRYRLAQREELVGAKRVTESGLATRIDLRLRRST